MNVEQIMTSKPATCSTLETMNEAARRMWEYDCGALPVLDEMGKLCGMITDRDICMAAYTQGKPLDTIPVTVGKSKQVHCVTVGTPIQEAEHIMQNKQIRRLPVVDEHGSVVGVLSLNDIARASGSARRNGVTEEDVARTLQAVCQPHRDTELASILH